MNDAMTDATRVRLAEWSDEAEIAEARHLGRKVGAYYAALVGKGVPERRAVRMASEYRVSLTVDVVALASGNEGDPEE